VLNDSGKVYTGNYKAPFGKPWNFGQFDDIVLDAILWLLEHRCHLKWTAMGNPIIMSRSISAVVGGNIHKAPSMANTIDI